MSLVTPFRRVNAGNTPQRGANPALQGSFTKVIDSDRQSRNEGLSKAL
jgi:hypothetical protein